jgi:predicted PurR-regulated permease PerM
MASVLTVIESSPESRPNCDDAAHAVEVSVINLITGEKEDSASVVQRTVTTTSSAVTGAALPVAHDWGSRNPVQIVVLIAATAFGLFICYLLAAPFLTSITWSLALAVVFVPLQRWVELIFSNRNIAAAISVLIIAMFVLTLVLFVGQRLVQEASGGAQLVNTRIESGEWRRALESRPRLAPLAAWMEQQNLPETVKAGMSWMSTTGASVVRGSIVEVMSLLLTFYLLFYFLRDRRAGIAVLRTALPLTSPEMDRLFDRVNDTIQATIHGTLIVAAVQGLLGGLMFWWLGLAAPLLWGVVMGLLAIVPILGAFIVWIPASLFLLVEGHWGQAAVLSIWGIVVVGTIDNVLRPVLVGNRLQLHTVMAFISVVGGIIVFGPAGLILGPAALTITTVLLEIWPKQETASTKVSADTEAISSFENEGGSVAPLQVFPETTH